MRGLAFGPDKYAPPYRRAGEQPNDGARVAHFPPSCSFFSFAASCLLFV